MDRVVSLRIPDEVLKRIDAEADRDGLTRTGLLLRPWLRDDGGGLVEPKPRPIPKRGTTVVVPSKRKRVDVDASPLRFRGIDALTGEEIWK